MRITEAALSGLWIVRPEAHEDERGALAEIMRLDRLAAVGPRPSFVQMNHSYSRANVLRGLHFQWDEPLGKYIRVLRGATFTAAVDIRKRSPTLGRHVALELSAENRTCLYAPPGFATGFCVLGDGAEVEYLYTAHYNPRGESNIRWNDAEIGIGWPLADPVLSERDRRAGSLREWLDSAASDRL